MQTLGKISVCLINRLKVNLKKFEIKKMEHIAMPVKEKLEGQKKIEAEIEEIILLGRSTLSKNSLIRGLFDEGIYVSGDFPVILGDSRTVVRLDTIFSKVAIYCPIHEMGDVGTHHASAFVGIVEKSGRRFISCSKCSVGGLSAFEELDTYDPTDLTNICNSVEFLHKEYLEGVDMVPTAPTVRNPLEDPQITLAIISDMGSGKTNSIAAMLAGGKDVDSKLSELGIKPRKNFGKNSVLAISPRIVLTHDMSIRCLLPYYKSVLEETDTKRAMMKKKKRKGEYDHYEQGNQDLQKKDRMAICVLSLARIVRPEGPESDTVHYDIVVIDEVRVVVNI